MYWCTSGVGLQSLPFIDNNHLGSLQRFPCGGLFSRTSLYNYEVVSCSHIK